MDIEPVVYVVQKPFRDLDLTPALDYGSLEYILTDNDRQIAFDGRRAAEKIGFVLQKYQPQDYLLAIGDPVAIGIACALAARATGGVFTLLKWDRIDKSYYPTFVDLRKVK